MRFLVDECTGPSVARWLRAQGHDVFSVYDEARGLSDDVVLRRAYDEDRILITNDKDFGEYVYREHLPHKGVIMLRLDDERARSKIEALDRLLDQYSNDLPDRFVVVRETRVRFAQQSGPFHLLAPAERMRWTARLGRQAQERRAAATFAT